MSGSGRVGAEIWDTEPDARSDPSRRARVTERSLWVQQMVNFLPLSSSPTGRPVSLPAQTGAVIHDATGQTDFITLWISNPSVLDDTLTVRWGATGGNDIFFFLPSLETVPIFDRALIANTTLLMAPGLVEVEAFGRIERVMS